MSDPARSVPFLLRLADGRTWVGAEFHDGFVCVHHPDEPNVCTIAVNLDGLLADAKPGDPLHGAQIEERQWW